jgi:RNA polymerase sigma-70 factor (ECF subfamily)
MLRFTHGDRAAFDLLIARHQRSVVNTIFRLIGDPMTAEDLAQEVFLNIFRAARSYRPTAEFRTWMFRIVRNVCYNELRRRARHPISFEGGDQEESPLDLPDARAAEPFSELSLDERRRLVRDAINRLPPAQRMAVVLRRYEGLSYQQIAHAMDNTVPGIKSLLSRAKVGLIAALGRYFKA